MRILIAAASAAFFILAGPVGAQTVCGNHQFFVDRLAERYSELVTARGVNSDQLLFELFTAEGGSWSFIVTNPSGRSCILGSGEGWEAVEPAMLPPMDGEADS